LFAERNLYADVVWIFWKFRGAIVSVIGGKSADAGACAGWDKRYGNDCGSEAVDVFSIHGWYGFIPTLSFERRNASQSVDEFFP
jgi:hypothetical protein